MFPQNFTQLGKFLQDRRSHRSRQISSLSECPDTSLGILGIVDIPLPSNQTYIGNEEFEKADFFFYKIHVRDLGARKLNMSLENEKLRKRPSTN